MSALAKFLLLRRRAPAYGPELLDTSGASGTATAANWTSINAGKLENLAVGELTVTHDGGNNPTARQTITVIGQRYKYSVKARSDGNSTPNVLAGSTSINGTTSTSLQLLEGEFVADATTFNLRAITSTGTQFAVFTNISLREIL